MKGLFSIVFLFRRVKHAVGQHLTEEEKQKEVDQRNLRLKSAQEESVKPCVPVVKSTKKIRNHFISLVKTLTPQKIEFSSAYA